MGGNLVTEWIKRFRKWIKKVKRIGVISVKRKGEYREDKELFKVSFESFSEGRFDSRELEGQFLRRFKKI